MSTSDLKLNLMERLALVKDAGFLQRLKQIFDKELGDQDDFTEEELAEWDAEHEKALRGEGISYSWEEVKRMAREALKK